MNTFLGLLIIAVGSFGQSSSYVPIRRVKQWSWESFWLVQGIFAWLVFPLAGALAAVPSGSSLFALLGAGGALKAVVYGALWGVGGPDRSVCRCVIWAWRSDSRSRWDLLGVRHAPARTFCRRGPAAR